MPRNTDPWSDGDRLVLAALRDGKPRHAGELGVDMPIDAVRMLLIQNHRIGNLTATRVATRTLYRITNAGEKYLASMLAGV